MSLLAVAAGGAAGAVSRYLASGWVQDFSGDFFPWGTATVNIAGSLVLGFAIVWFQSTMASGELREFVTIGFLASFTTFSTFSFEAVALLQEGAWMRAGGYTAGSVFVGLFAVAAGAAAATTLLQARG